MISINDVLLAKKFGSNALWISNHGGRMFNSGFTPVDILKKIKRYNLKLPIIVDGGVRKGTDIIKYLCLGADFVGIGRPAIFGLIIGGQKGVQKIFDILNEELKTSMFNGGFKSLKDMKYNRIEVNEKSLKLYALFPPGEGSKGLKLKNLRKVDGKPLLYYPINAAIKSKACDTVFVSTDSKKIADAAKKLGAEVPFLEESKNFLRI